MSELKINIHRPLEHMKKQERGIFSDKVEVWPNPNKGLYTICFHNYEDITCLHKDGYPCVATVRIAYVPDEYVLELKSLKYILSRVMSSYVSSEDIAKYVVDNYIEHTKPNSIVVATSMLNCLTDDYVDFYVMQATKDKEDKNKYDIQASDDDLLYESVLLDMFELKLPDISEYEIIKPKRRK